MNKQKLNKIINTLVVLVSVIAISLIGTVAYFEYQTQTEKIEILETEVVTLIEWVREIRVENIEVREELINLTEQDVKLYKQLLINAQDLIKYAKYTLRGFKGTNQTIDTIITKLKILNTETKDLKVKTNEFNETINKDIKQITQRNKKIIDQITKKPSYNYLKSVTVMIEGQSKKGFNTWMGTGIIVKEKTPDYCSVLRNTACPIYTYILTNAHTAGRDDPDFILTVKVNNFYKLAEVVKFHSKLDLALIKVYGKLEGKRAIKGIALVKPQDKVYLVGHHLGRPYIYGEGVFAGYDRIYSVIQIPILFGNSGSGVFNKDGKLVSLIFAISRTGFRSIDTAHGLGIDNLSIIVFLKDILN